MPNNNCEFAEAGHERTGGTAHGTRSVETSGSHRGAHGTSRRGHDRIRRLLALADEQTRCCSACGPCSIATTSTNSRTVDRVVDEIRETGERIDASDGEPELVRANRPLPPPLLCSTTFPRPPNRPRGVTTMTDIAGRFPWTDDQWNRARKVVQENARRARVASSFLPALRTAARRAGDGECAGDEHRRQRQWIGRVRLASGCTSTPDRWSRSDDRRRVYLRSSDLADPEMSSALAMIGQTTDLLGRVEDSMSSTGRKPIRDWSNPYSPMIYTVRGGQASPGLLTHEGVERVPVDAGSPDDSRRALVHGNRGGHR